ncbi:MAG TPA: RNA polymerase sigma factor [Polyangiaceae bacterium]|nr:RNA polymerase sigma factor [Polyangiaceae bacterium]
MELTVRELFHEHAGYVWSTLRRLGAAREDVEDLVHEVFLRVHLHRAEYDASRPIRPWLFGFAYRVAQEHRRNGKKRATHTASEPVDTRPLADEIVSRAEDRQLVLDALATLDLERCAVFVMFEVDEVPMNEIARSFGIPVNTGYSRLRLAREDFAAAVKRLKVRRGEK